MTQNERDHLNLFAKTFALPSQSQLRDLQEERRRPTDWDRLTTRLLSIDSHNTNHQELVR